MNDHELLITGGVVVTSAGTTAADVAVDGGRITAVRPAGTPTTAARVIDAAGRYVLPGLIDAHVHFRTPGLTHKENWTAGSRAAVSGGVTTVIDMPNTRPPLVTPADAAAKHGLIEGTSLVDYRFHGGVSPQRVDAVRELSRREASSIKVFLSGHHTAPDVIREAADLARVCALAAESDRPLLCHAEDERVFELLDGWRGEPERYTDYEPYRPRTAAIVAVARLVELARRYGTRIHVLHVSSREEADLLTAAAAAGIPVSFEVTGHHLTFTDADIRALGPRIRLRPAIRADADRDRLWQAVLAGEVTTVGSDHAPHTAEEKSRPVPDAPPGLPGVQELFPTVYTGLRDHSGGLGPDKLLPTVVRLMAEQPARLFGIDHRKGQVRAGMDADLVLFDPDRETMFGPADVHSACGWSAYEGRSFAGTIDLVLRRGEPVYQSAPDGVQFGSPAGIWLDAAGEDR